MPTGGGRPGRLLWLPTDVANQFSFALSVTPDPQIPGVEVPVIREHDLYDDVLVLPRVFLPATGRTLLRAYRVDGRFLTVRVTVFDGESGHLIGEHVQDATGSLAGYNSPGYMELYLEKLAPTAIDRSVRVVVESLTPGSKFWSFATITDNLAQSVTIVSPQ